MTAPWVARTSPLRNCSEMLSLRCLFPAPEGAEMDRPAGQTTEAGGGAQRAGGETGKPRSKHVRYLEGTSLSRVCGHSVWAQGQLAKSRFAKRQLAKQSTHQVCKSQNKEQTEVFLFLFKKLTEMCIRWISPQGGVSVPCRGCPGQVWVKTQHLPPCQASGRR